ncbi:MAG: hypothetical protein IJU47_07195 [Verrucomicrobia bacterium]|nr:hypothetical protein [Verrucomicrobiota bacterium]
MFASMKKLGLIAALTGLTCAAAQAFSLLGPWTSWQTLDLGYQLDTEDPNNPIWDAGGPMNLKEGYRWNIPVMTYAFDKSFMDYYGEKGVEEVERAMATINDTFAHMYEDNYLDSVPTSVARYNYRASALGLSDIYSQVLVYMTEKLGLGPAERYCWTLRNAVPPTDDTLGIYYTIRRNFDPETLETTPYVNGVLYSYRINYFGDDGQYAEALEITPDPTAVAYTSVAGGWNNAHQMIAPEGLYYTGLSRDDVGGLRWLYSADNYAFEGTAITGTSGGSAGILTPQYTAPIIVTNIDLAQFLIDVERTTNTLDQVRALYPGLNITSVNWDYETIKTTNYVYSQTSPWMPYGEVPVLVKQVENHFRLLYTYGYDNVITNFGGNVTKDKIQLITVSSGAQMSPWLPYGMGGDTNAVTNYSNISTNRVTGGIMILGGLAQNVNTNDNATNAANNAGGYEFLATNFVRRVYVTNLIASANSNGTAGGTNDNGGTTIGIGTGDDTGTTGTNGVSASFNQYMVTSYDLYEYLAYPIVWSDGGSTGGDDTNAVTTSSVLYRPGLANNFRMMRVNLDNLISPTFTATNMYFSNIVYMKMKDNVNDPATDPYGQLDVTTIRRRLTQPDIIFSAADLGTGGGIAANYNQWINHYADNYGTLVLGGSTNNGAGPGIISRVSGITFDTVANDMWINDTQGPLSLFEQNNGRYHVWASYDGSTNAPHLYPATSPWKTIEWVEQQITNSVPAK